MSDLPSIALSIRQPWAWAIMHGGKRIENRTWPTRFRGRFCIHASKGVDRATWDDDLSFLLDMGVVPPNKNHYHFGGIVAVATLVDCVTIHDSAWFFGPYGFVLADVQPVDFIPCKGSLGFFKWQRDDLLL